MNDINEGIKFLRDNKDKYKIIAGTNASGELTLTLIRDDGDSASRVFDLNMSDIYAQCNPARIIERLKRDIQESGDMIKTIEADSHEAAPEHDTPNNIPF